MVVTGFILFADFLLIRDVVNGLLQGKVDGEDVGGSLFLVPLNLVPIGGWTFVVTQFRHVSNPEASRGLDLAERGSRLILRRPSWAPTIAALSTGLGLTSALAVVLLIWFGDELPLSAAVAGTFASMGARFGAYAVARRGTVVVTLDRASRRLRLAAKLGGREARSIVYDQVRGLRVEPTAYSDSEGRLEGQIYYNSGRERSLVEHLREQDRATLLTSDLPTPVRLRAGQAIHSKTSPIPAVHGARRHPGDRLGHGTQSSPLS